MRTGSLVLALHNLDLSGANQVLVNIVSSSLRESNVVVLAPKLGPASQRFFDVGASIRIGDPKTILNTISDVILVLCNTIMTADIICFLKERQTPSIWVLHEFWNAGQIEQQIKMRPNVSHINVEVIKAALQMASTVVFVCEAQKDLYLSLLGERRAIAPYEVIYVGVPSIPHGDDDADIINYSTGGKKKRGIKDRFTADKIPRSSVSLSAVPSSSNITITRTDTHLHDVKESHSTATDTLRSLLGIDKSTGGLVPVPPSSLVPTGLATSADESAAAKSSTLHTAATTPKSPDLVFTILVLGVVCPRKNQLWAVRMLEELSNRFHHQHEEKDEKLGRMDNVPDEQRERETTLVSSSSERGSCAATFVQHPVSRHRKVLMGESGRVRRGVLDSDSEGALSDTELLECNDETCLDFPAESVPGPNPLQPVGASEAATSATSSSEGRTPPFLPLLDKSEAAMDADHQSAQISDTGGVATTAEDGRGIKLKLLIVGMRRSRPYEVEYGEKVEKEAARVNALLAARQGPVRCHNSSDGASDAAIEVHPVTDDVNAFFDRANCLLVPSTNEVTPLVIVEAMARQLPVLCTRVGGISEMLTHGVEGFLFSTEPPSPAKAGLRARTQRIYNSGDWRQYCGDAEEEAKEEKQANEETAVDSIPTPTSEGLAAGTGCEFLECTDHLLNLIASPSLCQLLGHNGRHRFLSQFRVELMTQRYLSLIRRLSPPVVLVDLDGVVVDWDAGFLAAWRGLFAHWAGTCPSPGGSREGAFLDSFTSAEDLARLRALLPASHAPGSPAPEPQRHLNFEMPLCLPSEYRALAEALFHLPDFFLCLPQKQGALQALLEMRACNLEVMLCSAPLMTSAYCAQEKVEWVRRHLGLSWLSRLILTCEKSGMKGDVLIDDKPIRAIRAASAAAAAPPSSTTSSAAAAAPSSRGEHFFAATWRQVIFDMPYNKGESDPRLLAWSEWPGVVLPMVGMDPSQYQEAVMSVNEAQPMTPSPQSEGVSGVHPPSTGAAALPPRHRAAPAVWPPPTLSRPILTRTSTHPPASDRALPASAAAASTEAHGWWGQYLVPSRYDQSTLPEVVNTTYLGQPITVLNPWTAPMCMSLASRSRPPSPCPPQAGSASARATAPHGKEAKVDHSTPLEAMAKVGSESAEGTDAVSTAAVSAFPTSVSCGQEQGVAVPVASSEPSKKSAERLVSAGIFATPPQTPPQTPPSTPPPAALPTISEDDAPNAKEGDYCGAFDRYGKCLHAEASPGPLFPCTCHGSTTLCPRITEGERKARQFLDCFKAVAPRPVAGQATGPHGVQGFGLHGTPAPSSTSLHKGKYVSTEGVIYNGQDLESGNDSDAMDLDRSAAGDVSAPAGYKWPATKGCLGRPEAGKQSRLDDPRDRSFDLCDAADCVEMEESKEEGPEVAAAAAAAVPEGQGKAISKSTSATSLSSTGTNWSTRTVRNADSDSYLEEGSQSDH